MKLLMITRKVDWKDVSPAAFTYTWVKKIGEKLDKLYVITWQRSDGENLSKNIEIISLSGNKFLKIFILQFKLLKVLSRVDGVFCHQNPEYTILSAPLVKLFEKRIIAWYTHGSVNWKLKLVNLLANKIVTASEKSCRLKNRKKIEVIGHGIDTEKFSRILDNKDKEKFNIISAGRISPTKDLRLLIDAIDILIKKGIKDVKLKIIGKAVLKRDHKYLNGLRELVKEKRLEKCISFGEASYSVMPIKYSSADLMINLSQTGSIDKAVLEAMACETMILTSNEAFENILDKRLMFKPKDSQDLTDKIVNLINLSDEEKQKISQSLRNEVVNNHNLDKLVGKILALYK